MASHVQATMHFAEILSETHKRIYVGVIMAAGSDWVEVSIAPDLALETVVYLRFLPATTVHAVKPNWRKPDRVGYTYLHGGPPEDHFAGIPGIYDPRSAAMRISQTS